MENVKHHMKKKAKKNIKEIWKDIPDFEGYYQVSNLGRVRSLGRYTLNMGGIYHVKTKILKQSKSDKGLYYVGLYKMSGRVMMSVAQLVVQCFLPSSPSPKHKILHKNKDKSDNRSVNLVWATIAEIGRIYSVRGEKNHLSKLKAEQVKQIKALLREGETCTWIAKLFNVHKNTISSIKTGRTWKHI